MRILAVTTIPPSDINSAGSPRTYSLLAGLSRNHHVNLVICSQYPLAHERIDSLGNDPVFESLTVLPAAPRPSRWRNFVHKARNLAGTDLSVRAPEYLSSIKERVRESYTTTKSDVLYVDGLETIQFVPDGVPVVVDLCDSLALLFERQLAVTSSMRERIRTRRAVRALRILESRATARFPRVTVISDVDRMAIDPSGKRNSLSVIPNGVDCAHFSLRSGAPRERTILFLGVLDYPPNVDAALYAANEIFPGVKASLPDTKFLIVGKNPPASVRALGSLNGVEVVADVPDVRPYYDSASVMLCPLRFGAGVKNKVLQAMAIGVPVIGSPIAFEGMAIEPGKTCIQAESSSAFEQALIQVLSDVETQQRFSSAGRAYVQSHHSWDRSSAALQALLEEQIGRGVPDGMGRRASQA